jgi:hypothetical protein
MPIAPIYGLSENVLFYTQLIFGLGAIASSLFCVSRAWKTKSMVPIYILIGGGLCSLYEAYADVGGLAIYPEIGVPMLIDELGRKIPLYVLYIYLFFFPTPFLLLIDRIEAGVTFKQWLSIAGFACISTVVFELLPLHYKVWTYYGYYPVKILDHPPIWGIMNAQSVLSGAAALALILRYLKPAQHFYLIAIVPVVFFGLHFAVAMPTYTALNSTTNPAIIILGNLLTVMLAIGAVCFWGKLICRPNASTS